MSTTTSSYKPDEIFLGEMIYKFQGDRILAYDLAGQLSAILPYPLIEELNRQIQMRGKYNEFN